ncbi:hypothetical protein Q5P01_026092 [Channa striata]|uniref:Uncharacterized protein n=1 Tax=Channa striata TaxID=64152 RepID=A0AA88LGU5_CHASR|nr:hypothetical protein Q5P01_026092 [Channa striata]
MRLQTADNGRKMVCEEAEKEVKTLKSSLHPTESIQEQGAPTSPLPRAAGVGDGRKGRREGRRREGRVLGLRGGGGILQVATVNQSIAH